MSSLLTAGRKKSKRSQVQAGIGAFFQPTSAPAAAVSTSTNSAPGAFVAGKTQCAWSTNPDETIELVVESDEDTEELANLFDGSEGEDDDDDVELVEPSSAEGAPSSKKASAARGVNFTPKQLKTLLDDYDSMRILMNKLYPKVCPHPPDPLGRDLDTYGFKCSDTWRRNFFNRKGFSLKTIGKRVNMKGTEVERMDTIETFHLQARVLQLSGTSHNVYGFTSPYYVISHDQVPLELAVSNGKTVHDTGCDAVYDAVGKDSDTKRFCTLNLFGAMLNKRSGLNIPIPHLVFAASGFREGVKDVQEMLP